MSRQFDPARLTAAPAAPEWAFADSTMPVEGYDVPAAWAASEIVAYFDHTTSWDIPGNDPYAREVEFLDCHLTGLRVDHLYVPRDIAIRELGAEAVEELEATQARLEGER